MFIRSLLIRINAKVAYAAALGILLTVVNTSSVRAAPSATTRYVATTGADAGDCSSSLAPCQHMQYAVDQSVSGDTIKVAAGTYRFSTNACTFKQTPSVFCILNKNLTILGGYATSNWNTANPSVNVTTIDGENNYRGVAVEGVYPPTPPTASLDMEGFTIQNCKVVGPTSPDGGDPTGYGGGMWVLYAPLALRDVKFMNNQAFGQNTGLGAGGTAAGGGLAINNYGVAGTSVTLQRVTFNGNQSQGGTGPDRGGIAFGAMYVFGSTVTVQDSTFTNNTAIGGNSGGSGQTLDGNAAYADGAAIGAEQSSLTLARLTVTGNQGVGGNAGTTGGAGHGGGIFTESGTSFTLSDSLVNNNSIAGGNALNAGYAFGGGIAILSTPASIDRTSVISDTARGGNSTGGGSAGAPGGGGVWTCCLETAGPPSVTLTNMIIADNSAIGGTVGTNPGGGGGGIQIQGLTATLTHLTFARNILGPNLVSGQAILVLAESGHFGTANVSYSIIADHTVGGSGAAAVLVQASNTLTFKRGLFAGNTKDTNADGSPMPAGTINGLATMLSAPSAGFVSLGAPNYNYHIQATSAAKDQAIGSTTPIDIDGQTRPYGSASDIGADEFYSLNFHLYLPLIIK